MKVAIIVDGSAGRNFYGCGNATFPCSTISFAAEYCHELTTCVISLLPGTYMGANNTDFTVTRDFTLTSENGPDVTTIDFGASNSSQPRYGINVPNLYRLIISDLSFINYATDSIKGTLLTVEEAVENSRFTITNCYFNSGSNMTNYGEFVSIFTLRDALHLKLFVFQSVFEGNTCVLFKGTGDILVDHCSFQSNKKTLFDLISATLFISNSLFDSNEEQSALITLDGLSHISIYGSEFTNSNAQSVVFIGLVPNPVLRSTFYFNNSTFSTNVGIYILNANGISGEINQCNFTNNQLSPLYFINSNALIVSSRFDNNVGEYSQVINYVDNDGISLAVTYEVIILSCLFINNYSDTAGGALRLSADTNTMMNATIKDTTFKGNYGYQYGGAILVNGNTNVSLIDVIFDNNEAYSLGGAIYCTTSTGIGRIFFDDVSITGNTAGGDDDDQIYNDPQNLCMFSCTEESSSFCYTYGQNLPSLKLTLLSLSIMIAFEIVAVVIVHAYCWVALKKSVARFGYVNLHQS